MSDWAVAGFLAVGLAVGLLAQRNRTARRQAEEAVRLRERVLALATHDLRTPLTVAVGYAEMLAAPGRAGAAERQARGRRRHGGPLSGSAGLGPGGRQSSRCC